MYAVDTVEHKAALRATYTPNAERFMAMTTSGASSVKAALVAWSASDAGVVLYCSRATAGKIVVFNAASSTVTRVLDPILGGLSGPRCLSVVYKPGGGDVVALGGDNGVEFIELASRSKEADCDDGEAEDEYLMRGSLGSAGNSGGGLRRGVLALPGGAESMSWSEDGKNAWIASGSCMYMIANPAAHLR